MNELVAVENLRTYFHERSGLFRTTPVRAVDGVTLGIARGETVALVGESGSGKTTLGRSILRLVDTEGGTIRYDGADITALPEARLREFRRRAQAVFQDPFSSISPYMTVRQIVEEPLLIHGPVAAAEREKRVKQALDLVKLSPADDYMEKYPHALSGGQRQRVSIARTMILEPEFVVADEPVSMLDASIRAEILSLLRELQERSGVSFLYVTHDIANARHFSDRVAVMYLGTIVELGETGTVIDSALHPYTRALLAAVPEPDPENRKKLRAVVAGEPPSASRVPSGCPFHPRCPKMVKGICDVRRPGLAPPAAGSATSAPGLAAPGPAAAAAPDPADAEGPTSASETPRPAREAPRPRDEHLVACVLYEPAGGVAADHVVQEIADPDSR